jgi:hypothetical protein
MKPPVDRNAAVVATLMIVFVISLCTIIFVTYVDYHPHFVGGSASAGTDPANTPK